MPSTARAALPYPALTNTPDVPRDIKALADAIDPLLGLPSFTSTTRPTTGNFTGRVIWETDTQALARWDGSSWQYVTPLDSGWVDISTKAGFAVQSTTERPQVRKIGDVVFVKGGWSSTGIAINNTFTVGTIPAGFLPPINVIGRFGTSTGSAAATMLITTGGDVQVRTGGTLSSYYMFGGQSWPVD